MVAPAVTHKTKNRFENVAAPPVSLPLCPDGSSQILVVTAEKALPPNVPTGWTFVGQAVHATNTNGLYVFNRKPVGGASAQSITLGFPGGAANSGTYHCLTVDGTLVDGTFQTNQSGSWVATWNAPDTTTTGADQLVVSGASNFRYARDIIAQTGHVDNEFNYYDSSASSGVGANAKAIAGVASGVLFSAYDAESNPATSTTAVWTAFSVAYEKLTVTAPDFTETDLEDLNLVYAHVNAGTVTASVGLGPHATHSLVTVTTRVMGTDGLPFLGLVGTVVAVAGQTADPMAAVTDEHGNQKFQVSSSTLGSKTFTFVYGVNNVQGSVTVDFTQELQVPSNVTATVLSSTSVRLNYTDNSSDEDGFDCSYRDVTGGVEGAWVVGPNVPAGSTSITVTGLNSSASYEFKVRSYVGQVTSAWSDVVTISNTAALSAVCYVDDLNAVGMGDCVVQIWRHDTGKLAGAEVAYLEDQTFEENPDYDPVDGKQKAKMVCAIPNVPSDPILTGEPLVMVIKRVIGLNELWTRMINDARAEEG